MQRTLCLDSLAEIDNGNARAVIDSVLQKCVEDLDDRGDQDGKERIAEFRVIMKKIDGGLSAVHVEAAYKIPRYATNGTACRGKVSNGQPKLLFQSLAPDDPDQRTLDEIDAGGLAPGEIP